MRKWSTVTTFVAFFFSGFLRVWAFNLKTLLKYLWFLRWLSVGMFFFFFGIVGTGFTSVAPSIPRICCLWLLVLIHQKVINDGASHRNRYNTGDLFHFPPDVIACKLWLWPCDLDTFAPPFNKNLDIWGISIDRWPKVLPFSFSQNLIANMSNEFQIFLEQFKLCSCSGT